MHCQFCGSEIPEGDQFCGQCGARAPVAPPPGATYGARPDEAQGVYGSSDTPSGTPPQWTSPYFDRDPNARVQVYKYASFGARLGAAVLDYIFAILLALIPGIILAVVIALLVEAGQEPPLTPFEADQQDEDTGVGAIIGFLIGFVPVLYGYWYVATSLGGGWGKRIFGLRIVKEDTGQRPGFGSGLVRVIVTAGFGLVPLVGAFIQLFDHLSMLWQDDHQTWHDMAAGTVVIRV